MRPARSLLIYVLAVFVGGALVAPWLYWLAQGAARSFPSLAMVAANPFHRFVDRSFMIIAVLGLWPVIRASGLRTWADVGLGSSPGQWRNLGWGLILGFGSLATVALLAVGLGERHFNNALAGGYLAEHLVNAGLAAVVVAVLEELVFRGVLFGMLRRVMDWRVALVLSSLFFAVVHFLARVQWTGPIEWTTGLKVLGEKLGGLTSMDHLLPEFLALALVGGILGLAYERTGKLYFSMGLHAGWIFWLKSYGFLTGGPDGTPGTFWGTTKLVDGWVTLILLGLTLTLIFRSAFTAKSSK